MKNVVFLISVDCSVKELPATIEKVVGILRDKDIKFLLNIPIDVLYEKGFNFGIQKGLDEITLNNLTSMIESGNTKILPSAYDLSYYQCFPVSSFEPKFKMIKEKVSKDKLLSKIIDYSTQAPFQADYLRKEFENEYFKLFNEYVVGIVKKNNKFYIAFKTKNETLLYSYVSLNNIVRDNENDSELLRKIKKSIENQCFIHTVIKSIEDTEILNKSSPILSNLKKIKKADFVLDYKSFTPQYKQILNMDVIYPLNNINFELSPTFFKESSYVFNVDDDRYKRSFNTSHSERINKVKNNTQDTSEPMDGSVFFNMAGEMKLEDDLVFLNFSDGQIKDMKFKNEKVFQNISSYSSIIYQKNHYKFKPTVSVTTERYNIRSFRSIYSISGKYIEQPGVVILDYTFINGFYFPIIKVEINYPVFLDVFLSEFNPYVLSISFSKIFLKDFSITTLYPDQSLGFQSIKNLNSIKSFFFKKSIDYYEGVAIGNAFLIKNKERSFLLFSLTEDKQVVSPLYYSVKSDRKFINLDLHLGKRFKNISGREFDKLEREISYFCICPNQNNFSILENIKDSVKKELKNI